jgi:hypothetical protein
MCDISENELQYVIGYLTSKMTFQQRLQVAVEVNKMLKVANSDAGQSRWQAIAAGAGMEILGRWEASRLAGRCADGFERGQGSYTHAVLGNKAFCGLKPGKLSVGWVEPHTGQEAVSCPKCLAAIKKINGSAGHSTGKPAKQKSEPKFNIWE